MRKEFGFIIAVVLITGVVTLMVKGYQSSVEGHNPYPEDSISQAPTEELVAKLYPEMSVKDIIECLFEAQNDSDLILISRQISPENASALCRVFYPPTNDHIMALKETIDGSRKYTIAKYLVKTQRFSGKAKNEFMIRLASALQDNREELTTQIAVYFSYLHDSKPRNIKGPISPEEVLEQIPSDALFETMVKFEELSRQIPKRNFTISESRRPRGQHRPGTHWPMTLMQSIVNCDLYDPEQKRQALRLILSKAIVEGPKWNDERQTALLERKANMCIDSLVFDSDCEVTALDVFVYALIGCHTKFNGDIYKDQKQILERFNRTH